MPSSTYPGQDGAPALPDRPQGVADFTTMMTIGPNGYLITARWSVGWSIGKVSSGWCASPTDAWAALGPRIAPHLNGAATNALTPAPDCD